MTSNELFASHFEEEMDIDESNNDQVNDYISDSNSESSAGDELDYELQSDEESDLDIVFDNGNIDYTVPDIKSNPPSWTDQVQQITVPQFKFKGGPTLPGDFDVNTTRPIDYFKLFFTDSIIEHIVKCTNAYARIEIEKKTQNETELC